MCIYFPALNKITVKIQYPFPCINDLLDQMKNVVYFTTLDLRGGYNDIRIHENDIWKNYFKTKKGLYEWMVIPFGICNSHSTFMRIINDVFKPFIEDSVIVYLDYILIFNRTWEYHVKHVRQVLDVLAREKLYLKMSKCEF